MKKDCKKTISGDHYTTEEVIMLCGVDEPSTTRYIIVQKCVACGLIDDRPREEQNGK